MVDERLFMRLLTQHPMADASVDGRAVVDAFEELVPEWAPRLWGHDDPPRQRYQRKDLPSVWWSGDPFSWKGRGKGKPEVIVDLQDLPETAHTRISVNAKAASVDPAWTVALVRRLVGRFGADYAYVHVVTPADQADSHPDSAYISPVDGPWMTASAWMLRSGLPNLWWANVFGPPVVEVLGADRIASVPAQVAEDVAKDTWLVQLTDSPLDAVTDPAGFAAARSAAKAHLGDDAFWDPSVGKTGHYRAAQLPLPGKRKPSKVTPVVHGPSGFTQSSEVRAVWEPVATEKTAGVWRLDGLDSRSRNLGGDAARREPHPPSQRHPHARPLRRPCPAPRPRTPGQDLQPGIRVPALCRGQVRPDPPLRQPRVARQVLDGPQHHRVLQRVRERRQPGGPRPARLNGGTSGPAQPPGDPFTTA